MTDPRLDRRRTCGCGHRFGDHASDGTACMAWLQDGNHTYMCPCWKWKPNEKKGIAA